MEIPSDVELLVWNIPYLEMGHESEIPEMEAVALNDVGNGGWGAKLLGSLEIDSEKRKRDLLILILMRTDPISESNPSVWKEMGWSARSIAYERIGNERLEVIGFWKTGQGVKPTILDICDSTMDEAKKLEAENSPEVSLKFSPETPLHLWPRDCRKQSITKRYRPVTGTL